MSVNIEIVIVTPMLIRKLFVGFFMLLLCVMLAPDRQSDSSFCQKQFTAEDFQDNESEHIGFSEDSIKNFVSAPQFFFQNGFSQGASIFEKAMKVLIITRTSDDIQTPPPNKIG